MKRGEVVAAIIVLLVLAGVGAVIWRQRVRSDEAERANTEDTRAAARQMVELCESAGPALASSIETGTTHFTRYFATDRAQAKQVLHDVVGPLLDSRDTACSSAKTYLDLLQEDLDGAGPRVAGHLAKLARLRAAYDQLAKDLDANAPIEELRAGLAGLLAAAR